VPDCESVVRALWEYLDGELDSVRHDEIERHLESCAGCRAHTEFEHRLVGAIATAKVRVEDPATLRRRVLEVLSAAGFDRS
jgi:anti-sigma factor (TIGR02949 family)